MKKVLSLLLVTSSIFSMQLDLIKPESVFVPQRLGSVALYHGKKGFYVHQDNKKHVIKKYFTDPMVRDITKKQLKAFLQAGYLSLNQMNDGEFSLKAKGRINGGGPHLGTFMYWLTKSVCYGTMAAAVGTVIVKGGSVGVGTMSSTAKDRAIDAANDIVMGSTKGAILYVAETATVPLSSLSLEAATSAVITTAPRLVNTAAIGASGTGILLVEKAIDIAGCNQEAALVTGAGVVAATGAGGLGVAASIEALSLTVGIFFGMLPTP